MNNDQQQAGDSSQSPVVSDVERYVHFDRLITSHEPKALEAHSIVNRKTAHFKIISPIDLRGRELTTSNWLPKEQIRPKNSSNCCLPGEPHFIRPVYHHLGSHKPCLSMMATGDFMFELKRKSKENEHVDHVMLFVLEKGHAT